MKIETQFNNLNGTTVDRKTLEIMLKRADKEGNLIISKRVAKILHEYNDDKFEVVLINLVEPFGLNAQRHQGLEKTGLDDCGRLQPGYRYAAGGEILKSAEKAPRKCDTTCAEPTKKPSEATKATAKKTALKEKFAAAAQKRVDAKKVVIRQNLSINKKTLKKTQTAVKTIRDKKKVEPKVAKVVEKQFAETPFDAEIDAVKKDLKTETDDKKLTFFQNKYKITAKDFIEVINRESKNLTIADLYSIATKIDVNEKDNDWNDFYMLLATACYNSKITFPKTFMLDQGTHFFDESLLINRKPILLKTKGFDSLANIAGKDNLRPVFRSVLCQKDAIVATDAFKIVVLKSDAEKNNAGKLLNINDKNEKYKAIVDGQYPDYSKFMTNNKFDSTVSHYVLELITQVQNYINATKNLGFTASYKILAIGGKTEFIVNAQYFLDLLLCLYANGSDKVSFFAENKNRIDFETNNGNRAALMCLNTSGYSNQWKNILLLNKHSHCLVKTAEGLNGASNNKDTNQFGLFGSIPQNPTIEETLIYAEKNLYNKSIFQRDIGKRIKFTKTKIRKAISGKGNITKIRLQLVFLAKDILQSARLIKIEKDNKNRKQILNIYKLRCYKTINNIPYKIFITVRETLNENVYYDHGAVKIIKCTKQQVDDFKKSSSSLNLPNTFLYNDKKSVELHDSKLKNIKSTLSNGLKSVITKNPLPSGRSALPADGESESQKNKLSARTLGLIPKSAKNLLQKTKSNNVRLNSNTKETKIIPNRQTIASKNASTEKLNFTNPAKRTTLADRMANKSTVFETFEIENKQISAFFGDLERKNKESVVITLTGGQGSGKTRMAFQFMNALAQKYRVGHASIEEHPESKLYFDKVDQYIDSTAISNIENPEIRTMQDLHHLICANDVIVIDSFAKMREIKKDFEVDADLRKKYNGKLFLVIFQQTVDGKMRGGSTSQFDADVVLFTEAFDDYRENYVYANKNRYQSKPLDTLQYNIFEQRLANNAEPTSQAENQPVTFSFALN